MAESRDKLVAASRALEQGSLSDFELAGTAAFAFECLRELLDDPWRDLWGDDASARSRLSDCEQDLVAVGVLEHVARCACDEHIPNGSLVLEAREGDDADRGVERLHSLGGLDPVHLRHPYVHQHHVRRGGGDQRQGLFSVAGLTDDLELVGVQKSNERVAKALVVVDNQDPHLRAGGGRNPLNDHLRSVVTWEVGGISGRYGVSSTPDRGTAWPFRVDQ